jgi:hypothetical protein
VQRFIVAPNHSTGLPGWGIGSSQRPLPAQHTTFTINQHSCPQWDMICNPNKSAAVLRLTPCGHRESSPFSHLTAQNYHSGIQIYVGQEPNTRGRNGTSKPDHRARKQSRLDIRHRCNVQWPLDRKRIWCCACSAKKKRNMNKIQVSRMQCGVVF